MDTRLRMSIVFNGEMDFHKSISLEVYSKFKCLFKMKLVKTKYPIDSRIGEGDRDSKKVLTWAGVGDPVATTEAIKSRPNKSNNTSPTIWFMKYRAQYIPKDAMSLCFGNKCPREMAQ